MAFATLGMVVGAYHRCGLGVLSGRPSRCCTTITLRAPLGEADSILFMNVSYPTPFWTISSAALTSCATLGLASKVCGSVLGLSRTDETCTYLPPIWDSTSAYSFSAPMALITDGAVADATRAPQPVARAPSPTGRRANEARDSAARRHRGRE